MNLESCTTEVQRANLFTLDGRGVVLVDTPGFDDTSRSDTEVLKMIAAFLATTQVNFGIQSTPSPGLNLLTGTRKGLSLPG